MLDAAEPLSWMLWAIAALSLAMYPLGLLLPGCSCCGGDNCDDLFDFNRCLRFEAKSQPSLPTQYSVPNEVTTPTYGFSRKVSRPEDIGARRVGTKFNVGGNRIRVTSYAARMCAGESQQAVYTLQYGYGSVAGTVATWNVAITGVDVPFTDVPAEAFFGPTEAFIASGQPRPPVAFSVEQGIGPSYYSVNATTSATIHDAYVVGGGQYLDAAFTTRQSLMSCASASLANNSSNNWWYCTLAGTIPPSHFLYVDRFGEVVIRFVVKLSRGSTSRYATHEVVVKSVAIPDAVPAGVTLGAYWQPIATIDSPMPATDATFGGLDTASKSVSVPSHLSLFGNGYVDLPDFEITPAGEQLSLDGLVTFAAFSSSPYVEPGFAVNGYKEMTQVTPIEKGYILRLTDPYNRLQISPNWIYDTARVARFLAGDEAIDATLPDPGYIWDVPQVEYSVSVSPEAAFCGTPLCQWWEGGAIGGQATNMYPLFADVIPHTVAFSASNKLPATWQTTDEKGTSTYTNLCFGRDKLISRQLRLIPGRYDYECTYSSDFKTCESTAAAFVNNYGAEARVILSAKLRWFFCGDLLWAIENGPCRTSLSLSNAFGNFGGTYSLGGDDGALWAGDWMCPDIVGGHRKTPKYPNGKCPPLHVEVTLSHDFLLSGGGISNPQPVRTVPAGTYAFDLVNESQSSTYSNPYGNCNRQQYICSVPAASRLSVLRTRETWCSSWGAWAIGVPNWWFGYDFAIPFIRPSGGWYQYYTPAVGTDFTVDGYDEIDPVQTSVTPSDITISAESQEITVQRCCPPRSETVLIPKNNWRHGNRVFLLETSQPYTSAYPQQFTRGATLTIEQEAAAASEACVASVAWLNGTNVQTSYNSEPVRVMPDNGCPLLGQVNFGEQPQCSFQVTSSQPWASVNIRSDKTLEVRIDDAVPPSFQDKLYFANGEFQTGRLAVIAISSQGASSTWTIFQKTP